MAEWVKFDGSEEHRKLLRDASDFRLKLKDGTETALINGSCEFAMIDQILICERHPHAEMIIEWARTGRSVYFFDTASGEWLPVKKPDWDENTRYLFDPPKKKLRYKSYLSNYCMEHEIRVKNEGDNKEPIGFIRWLDDDWQEVDV